MNRSITIIALLLGLVCPLVVAPAYGADEDEEGGMFAPPPPPRRQPLPWEVPRPGEEECRPEELVVLRELRERSRAMDAREQELETREETAVALEARLADEVERIDGLRAEMTELLERASNQSGENVASLSKMVDSMKAKDAAEMLAGMDEDVVLEVLRGIKPKQAAKVLGALPPAKSQALGDRYTLVPDPRDGLTEGDQ